MYEAYYDFLKKIDFSFKYSSEFLHEVATIVIEENFAEGEVIF